MKRIAFTLFALVLLASAPSSIRATDTNSPSGSPKAAVKPYLLTYCLVSGDKLGGDMGDPVTNIYKGQQIIFCCKDCIKDFKKDPDQYIKKLAEAQKKDAQKGK